jgi:hypothetical protein
MSSVIVKSLSRKIELCGAGAIFDYGNGCPSLLSGSEVITGFDLAEKIAAAIRLRDNLDACIKNMGAILDFEPDDVFPFSVGDAVVPLASAPVRPCDAWKVVEVNPSVGVVLVDHGNGAKKWTPTTSLRPY